MKATDFINELSDEPIVQAIRQAEAKTSGEVRVFISHKEVGDPVAVAQKHFHRLNMDRTRQRNGVLIFVAPASCKFAIIGDEGIHSRCGDSFWTEVAQKMTEFFKASQWTDGIVHAIDRAGELLARHFPRSANDVNELPDRVERD